MNLINSKETILELSADGQWVRVIVDGKLTVTFHVNYVKKVTGAK